MESKLSKYLFLNMYNLPSIIFSFCFSLRQLVFSFHYNDPAHSWMRNTKVLKPPETESSSRKMVRKAIDTMISAAKAFPTLTTITGQEENRHAAASKVF
jgi:hypothetical protein